ncbi:MAG TPA: hypothetical protein VMW73_07275 [Spirochaetia bacterium]|nr:hypothetical protein [Spirochaetia bacterium]
MKARRIYFVFLALLLLAYVVIFPRQTGKELIVTQRWATALPSLLPSTERTGAGTGSAQLSQSNPAQVSPYINASAPLGPLHAFRLGNLYGYIDDSGVVHYFGQAKYGLALGSRNFINYPQVPHGLTVENVEGKEIATIDQNGYPMYVQDHLFVLSSQGDEITSCDASGKALWSKQMGGLITSADYTDGLTVVGLLSGELDVFNDKGDKVFQAASGTATMPVILGTSIARGGNRLAVVSGVAPQIATIYVRTDGRFIPVDTRRLATDFRRPVLVQCVSNSSVSVLESNNGVEVVNANNHTSYHVELPGLMNTIVPDLVQDLVIAGSIEGKPTGNSSTQNQGTSSEAHIVFFLPDGRPVLHFAFTTDSLSLQAVGNGILWGANNAMYRVEFSVG